MIVLFPKVLLVPHDDLDPTVSRDDTFSESFCALF